MKTTFKLVIIVLWLTAFSGKAEIIIQPPTIVFSSPPELILLPGTQIYVVPEVVEEDIFYVDGWYWVLWHGHWFRSLYWYDWVYYPSVPTFYYWSDVQRWRFYYQRGIWSGHPWHYQQVRAPMPLHPVFPPTHIAPPPSRPPIVSQQQYHGPYLTPSRPQVPANNRQIQHQPRLGGQQQSKLPPTIRQTQPQRPPVVRQPSRQHQNTGNKRPTR